MANAECDADVLNSVDSQSTNPIPVIYQSGYLTIKDYDPEFGLYQLGFPNKEVEDGFLKFLLPNYASIDNTQTAFFITNFVKEIRTGKVDDFFKRLSSLFADTPYELVKDLENHYQNVLRKGASTWYCKPTTTPMSWNSNSMAQPKKLLRRSTTKTTPCHLLSVIANS
jgi:hypothetical protein